MNDTERFTIDMPAEQLAQIRRIVSAGGADSVSSYVAEAVRIKLHRDQSLSELRDLFDRKGQAPSAEHLAWARDVLGVPADDGGAVS
ncbi:ribbon-helix-helix domain-containing protein [Stackebrandtia soli]|uniref:ribbon-helix-helix domain-containing protein n=1 Tax=Stackebrandtia soli TaxID=1892856 RepID=UPI0039EB52A5